MNYIFNPVYTGADSFSTEIEFEQPESFKLFSDELDSAKYKLMELPFNSEIYRFIGDLNYHQQLYLKDITSGFDTGNFHLSRVNDDFSVLSFGYDESVAVEKMASTIKMITKKVGVTWPSHIPESIPELTRIKDELANMELANLSLIHI